jgi:hypothetical protein
MNAEYVVRRASVGCPRGCGEQIDSETLSGMFCPNCGSNWEPEEIDAMDVKLGAVVAVLRDVTPEEATEYALRESFERGEDLKLYEREETKR